MSIEEISCSDCKLEIIKERWTQILINWVCIVLLINKCVTTKGSKKIQELNFCSLVDLIDRYKGDICANDIDRAMLCTDDLEPFLMYKYPILRLRYFTEEKDTPKKLYIMTSILLYHCCANSIKGVVDEDICCKMDVEEQIAILKFCENLRDMEITLNNVENAIINSFTYAANDISKAETIRETKLGSFIRYSPTSSEPTSKIFPTLKFKSSITVLPSVITDTSSYCATSDDTSESLIPSETGMGKLSHDPDLKIYKMENMDSIERTSLKNSNSDEPPCEPGCSCIRCSATGPCCGEPATSIAYRDSTVKPPKRIWPFNKITSCVSGLRFNWKIYFVLVSGFMLSVLMIVFLTVPETKRKGINNAMRTSPALPPIQRALREDASTFSPVVVWQCKNSLCEKVFQSSSETSESFSSLSQCTLICMGPQLWPLPTGYTRYSKNVVALATNKLRYKFKSVPSEKVYQLLAETFKIFLGELAKLEIMTQKPKRSTDEYDLTVKKVNIQIDIETDTDPRIRLITDEGYTLKADTLDDKVMVIITAASFCGARHGLQTLSQLIMIDQSSGYLITLSNIIIEDTPSHKYRGLMIDTGRNYIPVSDLMRTIDAMATVKLNTFHWRISDVTSFPLILPKIPNLAEYGPYDRKLVYTKDDVKTLVNRAAIRGIRVLIEVAAPGPVGRPWSWLAETTCPVKNENNTCNNLLCLRLNMHSSVFDYLEVIYSEILNMTHVDDVFHLSDGTFSVSNCFNLIDERQGFLGEALDRLRLANNGILPELPIVWYTPHLLRDFEASVWDGYGVQVGDMSAPPEEFMGKFRMIHSSRWDLSCEMKNMRCQKYRTWQEMYTWKSWRNMKVLSLEGGEAVLWTDLVDSGNLDYHLWPRVAAVAERLWSDSAANFTVNGQLFIRMDAQRRRMLLRGVKVQPVWPVWCSFNPSSCIQKLPHT